MANMSLLVAVLFIWMTSVVGKVKMINYTQQLDHFECESDLCNFTFPQKLLVSNTHWAGPGKGAPIFVLLGGLDDVTFDLDEYGILSRSAVEFKAMLVFIEHRFRHDSTPLGSIDLAMENHRIRARLSIEQALQDYADIIQSLKANLSAHNSPVIVVGFGYGGALATWFRLKYPHIAIGALASSTPLLYYGSSTPGDGYCDIVSNDFELANPYCYRAIYDSWKVIDYAVEGPNGGLSNLTQMFNTCSPVKSVDEVKAWFAQLYSARAQYDPPNYIKTQSVCTDLVDQQNINEGLYAALYNQLEGQDCFSNIFTELFSPFELPSQKTLAWQWLRCTELIFPVGCEHQTMLPSRPFNMTQFQIFCRDKFGIARRQHSPISFFGSKDVVVETLSKLGENIIFSNGLRDPSSSGAILQDLSKTVIAITTTNDTYARDMYPITIDDPSWLIEKREREVKIFQRWIDQFHHHISKGSYHSHLSVPVFILELLALMFMYL